MHEYSLFLLRWPVLLSCCCCCVKTAIVTKCSFVSGLQALMGYYAEWPDSHRLLSLRTGGTQTQRGPSDPIVSLQPLPAITSSGPVERVNIASFRCSRLLIFPLSLQRDWRSTSANLARWRSVWWCGIPLPRGRGKKEACALLRPITGLPPHALPAFPWHC